jgi:hypothetical protein
MPTPTFIVTVGGGIAASALPKRWPREEPRSWCWSGKKNSKIVYRGEGVVPWGVAEGNELGICGLLKETCAHEFPMSRPGLDCET